MQLDTHRTPGHYLAMGAALTWGLVELVALARRRWMARRWR
jgi:hypothetical protein